MNIDEKSLHMLEFPKVREIFASFVSFPVSRELVLNLMPSADGELVSLWLRQSAEARQLLAGNPGFSIGGARDVRESVAVASRGKTLDPLTLLDIASTLASANKLHTNIGKLASELPALYEITNRIVPMPHLEQEISRCIDDASEISDSASPKLAELRQQLRETRQRLLRQLEGIVRSITSQGLLQESLITEREGRYVIPVKVEFQKDIKGIVHDVSNTGATVFIEPFGTVELGNKLRQLALEEEREIQRILSDLSAEVGANSAAISQDIALIAELDLALSKARYAERAKAIEPHIIDIGEVGQANAIGLNLIDARHPLLREKAVPLSVEMGDDFSTLIITGPNTGGKTVALKTIGLLTLMAQSGMPIPASEESCLPVFDGVFADIGDEQSIEQTLSTFSWHMSNIVRILRMSTSRSLVLLDELGTSTDPAEGTALAQSVLLHFLQRGTFVVATTHFSELKIFAHATSGMQNASFEFDPVTLGPTYRLTMGIPGGSNALAIASRLGLPEEIVASAKGMLSKGAVEIEELLTDLTHEKQNTRILREELDQEKAAIDRLRENLETDMRRLKEQEQYALREARDRIATEASELQRQIRSAAAELKKARTKESIDQSRQALKTVHEQLAGPAWQPKIERTGKEVVEERIAEGDHVRLIDTHLTGTVLSLSEKSNQIEIQAGQTRVRVDVSEVEKIAPPSERSLSTSYTVKRDSPRRKRLLELDLRGKRAEEVEPELDSYLNDASLSGVPEARIIHGYGTGTVRQIVRDMLTSHPLVKSFRPGEQGEGGDGVTVVKM
ncbi:MAG: endonuclease MutS2 [Dehalococcoidia bacterium]|nr:endonuclease MutS2 [Dehalococcoidia bacterium]